MLVNSKNTVILLTSNMGGELVEKVVGASAEAGAREIDHILTQTFLPELSGRILEKMALGEEFEKVHVSVDEMGGSCRDWEDNEIALIRVKVKKHVSQDR